MNPLQRTKQFLEEAGWYVEKTEHWNHFAKVRNDLLGFADLIALPKTIDANFAILVQATSYTNHSARKQKILASKTARLWHKTGGQIWIISWRKIGKDKRKDVWAPRVECITTEEEAQTLIQ